MPSTRERARVRVFLSSTWRDLEPERGAVAQALQTMVDIDYVGMEYFGADVRDAEELSLDKVAGSDVYVGVVGGRFGSGITEEEYREARRRGLPCLLFFKSDEALDESERDAEPKRRLEAWKKELSDPREGQLPQHFSTPDELASQVTVALHNHLVRTLLRAADEGDRGLLSQIVAGLPPSSRVHDALREQGVPVRDNLVGNLMATARASVFKALLDGIRELPTRYEVRIQNFLAAYLGTPEEPVPFGGRGEKLDELDAWLDNESAPPYVLLAAQAGSGKSALLVHWTQRLLTRADVDVVFVPVSIRYGTNQPEVIFSALGARLAKVHGLPVPADPGISGEQWKGIFSDNLARPLTTGRRLVVVLDGLDEAVGWEAGRELLPVAPPEGVRVVVSARYVASAPDDETWMRRLGWHGYGLGRPFELRGLDPDGIADVLRRMGVPLEDLGRGIDVAAKLHELTGGDPLLVEVYARDLWHRGRGGARLEPEDLLSIRPGLEGYFEDWWKDQEKAWGEKAPLHRREVEAVLNVLSAALGPLTTEDLLEVLPEELHFSTYVVKDALDPIDRFVTNAQGWVFSHPGFGIHLFDRLAKKERASLERAFLDWGARIVEGLGMDPEEEEHVAPEDAPSYLLQYYGAHLERGRAGPEEFLSLLAPGWKKAWETRESGFSGFGADIERASRVVAVRNDRAVDAEENPPLLAEEAFCALCRASRRSLAGKLPPELLPKLVASGTWELARALAYARQMPAAKARAKALSALALDAGPDRGRIEEEALSIAADLVDPDEQAEVLGEMVSEFEHPPREAFAAAIRSFPDYKISATVRRAASSLARKGRAKEGLELITSVLAPSDRHSVLAYSLVETVEQGDWDVALEILGDEDVPAWGRDEFVLRLAAGERGPLPEELTRRLRSIAEESPWNGAPRRTEVLLDLDAGREPVLEERDLEWLPGLVAETLVGDDLEGDLNRVLHRLGPQLDGDLRRLLRAELARVGDSDDARLRGRMVLLTPDPDEAEEREALALLDLSLPTWSRASVLSCLAPFLWSHRRDVALAIAAGEREPSGRVPAEVEALASSLASLGMPGAALELIRTLGEEHRAEVLLAVLEVLPEDGRRTAVEAILELRAGQPDPYLVERLAEHLGTEHFAAILASAESVGFGYLEAASRLALRPPTGTALTDGLRSTALAVEPADRLQFLVVAGVLADAPVRRAAIEVALKLDHPGESPGRIAEGISLLARNLPPEEVERAQVRMWELISSAEPDKDTLRALASFDWGLVPADILSCLDAPWFDRCFGPQERGDRSEYEKRKALSSLYGVLQGNLKARARRLLEPESPYQYDEYAPVLEGMSTDAIAQVVERWLGEEDDTRGRRAKAVETLAPFLSDALLPLGVRIARDADEERDRASAYNALLPRLEPGERRELLDELTTEPLLGHWRPLLGGWDRPPRSALDPDELVALLGGELTRHEIERLFDPDADRDEIGGPFVLDNLLQELDPAAQTRVLRRRLALGRMCVREFLVSELMGGSRLLDRLGGEELRSRMLAMIERTYALFP